ncbi:MAG: preprotein translocase subunit SecY [Phycisphaeraceae bacterium]
MLKAFFNIFKIPDLRNKVLFTLGMLVIYRIGFWIPLPGVNQAALKDFFEKAIQQGSAAGQLAQFISIFTGGNLGQSTLFGLGIMPYISAAIIFQLLATVLPSLSALQKEGPAGQQKIQEYTRYATVGLCIIQAFVWLSTMQNTNPPLVYAAWRGTILFWVSGLVGLTAGTVFLMWLGEQVDKYGIGNGASLIITAGIIARIPHAIQTGIWPNLVFSATEGGDNKIGPMKLAFLIASFIFVVAGCVMITQGQRRIPVQQAKHTRGRRVYGGQKSYLPLRVNHGGVMPIIFASSLLIIPNIVFRWMGQTFHTGVMGKISGFLSDEVQTGKFLYEFLYIAMIYFFAYFWTTVQFQPRDISINLRDHGSFIPGLRPGPRTAEYLERVMERITYVGAGFLAIIAVIPSVIHSALGMDMMVTSFLGGTALLISVSVILDFVQRIEANLLMRNYQGFLATGGGGKGPRIRGPRG